MINKKVASELAVGTVLILALVVGGIFWIQNKNDERLAAANNAAKSEKPIIKKEKTALKTEKNSTVCTQEAKLCEDGSYVSRTGPNCEFAACPNAQVNKSQFSFETKSLDENFSKSMINVLKDGTKVANIEYKGLIGKVDVVRETKNGLYFAGSPDGLGGYYIFGNIYNILYYLNFSDNKISEIANSENYLTKFEISKGDRLLAFINGKNVEVKNLETGKIELFNLPVEKENVQMGDPAFSPDGKKLAIATGSGPDNMSGEIYILNLDNNKYDLYKKIVGNTLHIIGWKNDNEIDWEEQ